MKKFLCETPNCHQVDALSRYFTELIRKNPHVVQNIFAAFIKERKKMIESKKPNSMSPYTGNPYYN